VLSHDARDRPHNRSYPHNIFYQGASETMNILRVFHWWIRTASKHIYRSAYLHQVQETRNLNLIVNGLIAGMMQVNARSRRKNCVLHTFRTSSSSRVILIGEVEVLEISGRSMAKSGQILCRSAALLSSPKSRQHFAANLVTPAVVMSFTSLAQHSTVADCVGPPSLSIRSCKRGRWSSRH
jgi:hypothetical protein